MNQLPILTVLALALCGCAFNRPNYSETSTSTNGTVTVKRLSVPTWALWPATTSMEKQRVSIGKTMSVGTVGLQEDSGGTNVIEALRAIDSIVGRIK